MEYYILLNIFLLQAYIKNRLPWPVNIVLGQVVSSTIKLPSVASLPKPHNIAWIRIRWPSNYVAKAPARLSKQPASPSPGLPLIWKVQRTDVKHQIKELTARWWRVGQLAGRLSNDREGSHEVHQAVERIILHVGVGAVVPQKFVQSGSSLWVHLYSLVSWSTID